MKSMKMPASHDMHPNVTPLINIVMCLIIFYMLVAKIGVNTGEDKNIVLPISLLGIELKDLGNAIALNVNRPEHPEQLPQNERELPIITTLDPTKGEVVPVKVMEGTAHPLTVFLKRLKGQNAEFKVIIRADENLEYKYLQPVLLSAAEAQVKNINFATRKQANVITVKTE